MLLFQGSNIEGIEEIVADSDGRARTTGFLCAWFARETLGQPDKELEIASGESRVYRGC